MPCLEIYHFHPRLVLKNPTTRLFRKLIMGLSKILTFPEIIINNGLCKNEPTCDCDFYRHFILQMKSSYIYLLIEREFIKTREAVYKIGMTRKENHVRFDQYPKGSQLLFQIICDDCLNHETRLIRSFKTLFTQRTDYGREYFEGDYRAMIDCIYTEIKSAGHPACPEPDIKLMLSADTIETEDIDVNITDTINPVEPENVSSIVNNDSEPIYYVSTCAEWMKWNNIETILITNKIGKGYLKFKNQLLRVLVDNTHPEFGSDYQEDLMAFIQYNERGPNGIFDGILYLNDCKRIYEDVIKTKFVKPPLFYTLCHYECIVHLKNTDEYAVLDCRTFTIFPIDEFEKERGYILPGFTSTPLYISENINTEIVESILHSLVSANTVNEYKRIMYNLFVHPIYTIVFYDEMHKSKHNWSSYILSEWIISLFDKLTTHGNKLFHSSEYYYDPQIFNTLIKKGKYRCVIITPHKKYTIEKQIKLFRSKEIKTIIVRDPMHTNAREPMYNIPTCVQYITEHWDTICPLIRNTNSSIPPGIVGDIFDNSSYLNEYLFKWGCIHHLQTSIPADIMQQSDILEQVEVKPEEFCKGGQIEKEPEGAQKACSETFGENRKILDLFLDEYEFTNDPADYVPASELKTGLDIINLNVSATKLGTEIGRYAAQHGFDKVASVQKKIRGKTVRVWPGIRRIAEKNKEYNV